MLLSDALSSSSAPVSGRNSGGDCDFLLEAAKVPLSYLCIAIVTLFLVYLYNFLELHIVRDLLNGFRGDPVTLSFHTDSILYKSVVSKCSVLHGRYGATPWLASPHFQTAFLGYLGKHPVFDYQREMFITLDGGTVALDWLRSWGANGEASMGAGAGSKRSGNTNAPIVMVTPGITGDSASSYIKQFAHRMAKMGWDVCVLNHRGYFASITSDCFYNAGWTEDICEVALHLHRQYPDACIYAVGVSVGANMLVKYLGENGADVPIAGAAAICSPWDLLVGDRFMHRNFLQKLYSRAITKSLKRYAQLHQSVFSRLADWNRITKARTLREFDSCATSLIANFKTTDAYYRHSSSVNVVHQVAVPLLSLSSLDDPVCSNEAIPWDECRANSNIVVAATRHGGHVAYYEGMSAYNMWWIRATSEFLHCLHSTGKLTK